MACVVVRFIFDLTTTDPFFFTFMTTKADRSLIVKQLIFYLLIFLPKVQESRLNLGQCGEQETGSRSEQQQAEMADRGVVSNFSRFVDTRESPGFINLSFGWSGYPDE